MTGKIYAYPVRVKTIEAMCHEEQLKPILKDCKCLGQTGNLSDTTYWFSSKGFAMCAFLILDQMLSSIGISTSVETVEAGYLKKGW